MDESVGLLVGLSRIDSNFVFPKFLFELVAKRAAQEEMEIAKFYILLHEVVLRGEVNT